jgi:hypothetical protein
MLKRKGYSNRILYHTKELKQNFTARKMTDDPLGNPRRTDQRLKGFKVARK